MEWVDQIEAVSKHLFRSLKRPKRRSFVFAMTDNTRKSDHWLTTVMIFNFKDLPKDR